MSSQDLKPETVYYLQIISNGKFEPVIKVIYVGINQESVYHKKTILFNDTDDGFITVGGFDKYRLKGPRLFINRNNLLENVVSEKEEEFVRPLLERHNIL